MEELCADLAAEYHNILVEGPKILGVQELASSSVKIRIVAMADSEQSWQLRRVFNQKIKETFDHKGISIPYDHLIVVDKDKNVKSE